MLHAMFMLVGDQTIPNLMPFLQLHTQTTATFTGLDHLYRVVLVTTTDHRIKPNAAKIRDFLLAYFPGELNSAHIQEIEVDSLNLAGILEVCRHEVERLRQEAAELEQPLELIFNMNGGTKIMSLATYPLALENSPDAQIIYLDSHTNQILRLLPPAPPWSLRVALTVPQYLQAHGYILTTQELYVGQSQISDLARSSRAAQILGQTAYETVQELRRMWLVRGKGEAGLTLPEGQDEAQLQTVLNLVKALDGYLWQIYTDQATPTLLARLRNGEATYQAGPFATIKLALLNEPQFFPGGKWLEQYVFDSLQSLLLPQAGQEVKIRDVMAGLKVKQSSTSKINNEIDVAFTWGQHLALCSCKAGRSAESNWIYDLNDRARTLGAFCHKVLICSSAPSVDFVERAERDKIQLIRGCDLPQITQHLATLVR